MTTLTKVKPLPYCTPVMRKILNNLVNNLPARTKVVGHPSRRDFTQAWSALKSRGWVDENGITPAGHAYLDTPR